MAKKVGLSCKLYLNGGTYASPSWGEIDNAKDVTLNLEAGEADVSTRGGGGWREMLQALKDGSIEFELVYDGSDSNFASLQSAFFNGTAIDVVALDGDSATSGNQGLRMTAVVTGFTRNEPLEEGVTVSVVIKPTPNTDSAPEWFTVA